MSDWEDEFGDGMAGKKDEGDYEWPVCPYCKSKAMLVDSKVVYGKSYGSVYICGNFPRCDSYVGVNKGTTKPLGTLANSELRRARNAAHNCFDPLWRSGKVTRNEAYEWLSDLLEIPVSKCHIGVFDIEMCKKVIQIMEK